MERLDKLYNNLDTKMTQARYLEMCEQLGKEPNPEEMPPDINDLPEEVQQAIFIFNLLGDRVYPDIGFVGKDYTNLPILLELHGVEDKELVLEVLNFLDSRAIKKSSEQIKRERDKLKRKSSG
jgi:hypothetical protein